MVEKTDEMKEVLDDVRDLGKRVRKQMDPLCDEHLRGLEYHPVSDEFRNTKRYSEFEDMLSKYMEEDERINADNPRPTVEDECRRELLHAFDQGFNEATDSKVNCVACKEDKPISVNDPEALKPENILLGKTRSGRVDREDEYDEEARWQ